MSAAYRVTGESGAWVLLGQATYLDDDGRTVEHDWVLLREAGGDREVAVAPDDVTPIVTGVSMRKTPAA